MSDFPNDPHTFVDDYGDAVEKPSAPPRVLLDPSEFPPEFQSAPVLAVRVVSGRSAPWFAKPAWVLVIVMITASALIGSALSFIRERDSRNEVEALRAEISCSRGLTGRLTAASAEVQGLTLEGLQLAFSGAVGPDKTDQVPALLDRMQRAQTERLLASQQVAQSAKICG